MFERDDSREYPFIHEGAGSLPRLYVCYINSLSLRGAKRRGNPTMRSGFLHKKSPINSTCFLKETIDFIRRMYYTLDSQ